MPAWAGPYDVDNTPPAVIYNPDVTITVRTTPLCPYKRYLDGQWFGNCVASDGKVYSGSSTHSDLAAGVFFQYDPGNKQISMLASDLSAVCGERTATSVPPGTAVPQGKLHSPIVESKGWLYFAPHLGDYSANGYANYPGSHLVGYKLGSIEAGSPVFQDFGVVRGNYTCYAGISVDPVHDYVYCMVTGWWGSTTGGYLYRYNTNGTGKTLITSFASGGEDFFQFVDERGDMWFSQDGNRAALYRVSGATGAVTVYPNALPIPRKQLSDAPDAANTYRFWAWGERLDGNRAVFSMLNEGGLWEFDSSKVVGNNASGAFRLVKWIGTHASGIAVGGDTCYYLQSANPNWTQGADARDHHLKSVDVNGPNAPIMDWGRIVDQDGRTPLRCPSMSADDQGNVYMTGDWRVLGSDPVNYRTLRREFGATGPYIDLWRGEFFGAVTVPEPATMMVLALGAAAMLRRRRA